MAVESYEVWRGVSDLVAAEVLTDTDSEFTCGTPFAIAGVAQISRTVNADSARVYYDNKGALVINGESAEEITIECAALPLEIRAKLMGLYYDAAKGALYEGGRKTVYFAIGYKTQKVSSDPAKSGDVYVWRLKGSFAEADQEHNTINDGTDSNGESLTYTGVFTNHKFTNKPDALGEPSPATSCVVDTTLGMADVSAFFDAVTTPDTLVASTAYELSIDAALGTTLTVKRGNTTLANGAAIYAGDHLKITCTGGTISVNGTAFISGDIHIVSGDVVVETTQT